MPTPISSDYAGFEYAGFEYAMIRVVPRVEREEFVNAGLILVCLERQFLEARVTIEKARLKALWPGVDIDLVKQHLEAIPKICSGELSAGPIGRLSLRERFHWLVAPRSTMIQMSPVHSGLCENPVQELDQLFKATVLTPPL